MLSRAIIRTSSTPRFAEFRVYQIHFRKSPARGWHRPLTSCNANRDQQNSSNIIPKSSKTADTTSSNLGSSELNQQTQSSLKASSENPKPELSKSNVSPNFINDVNTRSIEEGEDPSRKAQIDSSANLNDNSFSENSKKPSSPEEEKKVPNNPLPDLTQGIPSTIDYEVNGKYSPSDLNLSQVEDSFQSGRGRGSLPASAYISSSERKRLQVANYFYGGFFVLTIFGTLYLGRNWDTEEQEEKHLQAPSGWSISLMWKRAKARISDELSYYQAPAFRKLLPDVDPMFERPYTLVLSLEDLLICSEWSREHGWRLAKRPGVDYFLRYLSQYYELVVFTTQPSHFAEPIIRKLDPYHIIMWPLFREATLYENGEYIKDLSFLNRDLSKVIILDTNKAHVKKQPENAIVLEPWRGDLNDKELVSLIPFLEYIHTMAYSDVRKALTSFEGKYIPTEFARREAIARKKFLEQLEEEKKKLPKRSGLGLLRNALGIKHQPLMYDPNEPSPAEAFAQGKMLQDIARERGQRNYQLLEKEIRENGEKWLQEEAALEEKSKEESMKAMKSGLTGFFWFGKKTETEPELVK